MRLFFPTTCTCLLYTSFVVVAVTQIMPLSPLFSLPFLAMGALAVVMGVLSAVGKNGLPHRVGYDVETGIEEETIAGLMEDVDKTDRPSAGTHDHIPSTALEMCIRDRSSCLYGFWVLP